MDSIFTSLDVLKDKLQDAIFALTSCVCQPSATIKVNGRSYKIVQILGEGGFSFVYLAQDEQSGVSIKVLSMSEASRSVLLESRSVNLH